MKKKTLLPYKQALLYGTAVSLLLFGCGTKRNAPESFERSEYYTRGIGQYPGSPAEDFSPNLKPDYDNYRNIAKLRTAQLITRPVTITTLQHNSQPTESSPAKSRSTSR